MFYDTDFEHERNVYGGLGPSSHPHLINLLFTYKQRSKHYFVFPSADGNLRDYWEKNPRFVLRPRFLKWSLEQIVGIASGLAFFHEFTSPTTRMACYGRHGNIKAQNILWFRDRNILKIADLGVANVRGKGSRSNASASNIVVSPTYSPPDVERKHSISRKWDIWGLGCLYLEFITYLVLGPNAIDEFSDKRCDGSNEIREFYTDSFYSVDYETVKPSVGSWVGYLKQNSRCSTMMHDILDLVMREMIVIDPNERCSSLEVHRKLKRILERALEDQKLSS
ncbi:kinase-like domain-containing protein [Aspergillus cavernicola]|uniref:Kinase-like domain-containing protein n=1 Tax=Aspergillus cavernicola TaxID=176166 RepID=A0ABR4I9S8_9EURO